MSSPDPDQLRIGDVARLTGRRASSIRYYEEIGLLPEPRRVSARRVYEPEILKTLAVIDTAQRAGLTLEEIRTLIRATPEEGDAIDQLRAIAERKLPEITALIERSELVRGWLECAARCECPSFDDCLLFDGPDLPLARSTRDETDFRLRRLRRR